MKANKLMVAIVALFCVVQVSAMHELDQNKRIQNCTRQEIMTLVMNIPSLHQDYDNLVREGRERVMQYYPNRLDQFEQEVLNGMVMATDYTRMVKDRYGNETVGSLKRRLAGRR